MKLCLVGGIFGNKSRHAISPETVLLDGFQKAGLSVHAVGHAQFHPSDDFDIVHVHHFGRAAMKMAAANNSAQFVFTGHNGPIVTGYERSLLKKYAFQYVIDKADAVVALSKAETRYFATARAAHKVHLIPNGIPPDVFRAKDCSRMGQEKGSGTTRFNLIYVGQLIELKGVDFLLKAFQQIRQQWNVRLRLVYHNAQLESQYKQLVEELGIASDVEFVGGLGPSQLAEAYRQADLLVLPSFADCLPSVVTEALLCGTPVVAGAVCGVPEQVGKYGRVVPPGDVPALASAIDSVLRDQPQFLAMAAEMRAYAEAKYNPQAMVSAHLALYENLLATGNTKRRIAWLDPIVRLAVKVYWRNNKTAVA